MKIQSIVVVGLLAFSSLHAAEEWEISEAGLYPDGYSPSTPAGDLLDNNIKANILSNKLQGGKKPLRASDLAGMASINSNYELQLYGNENQSVFNPTTGNMDSVTITGQIHKVNASYARYSADGLFEYGARLTSNILASEKFSGVLWNNVLNGYGKALLLRKENLEVSGGANLGFVYLDKDYMLLTDSRFAYNGALNLSARQYLPGEKLLQYGIVLQENMIPVIMVNELSKTTSLSIGAMFGMPVHQFISVSAEGYYTRMLLAIKGGKKQNLDNVQQLTTGVHANMAMTKQFGVNFGMRMTFLVKNYNAFDLVLGGQFHI